MKLRYGAVPVVDLFKKSSPERGVATSICNYLNQKCGLEKVKSGNKENHS